MNTPIPKLAVEIVWFDEDMLELSITACSQNFSGRATFYAAFDEPKRFAEEIEGFPRSLEDTRELEFGSPDLTRYGGAKVRLSCKDALGHLLVQVTVYRISDSAPGCVAESAIVEIPTVPSAVDSFVQGLLRMRLEIGATAVLCQV